MILTYQAHRCSPEGICFTLSEYIPLIKVWTCGPVLWSVGWGVSRRYCRSCFPTLARSAVQGWHACPHGLVYTGYPTRPQPLLLWPARSSGLPKSPHAARGSQPVLLDAWCRGAGNEHVWHGRTKSFISLSFLLVPHISLSSIYRTLHIFQVHTKCILCGIINYLIWFEDGYRILQLLMRLTSPLILIEQKINVCHVSAIVKHVTVSFRSMKASRLYLKWMQFPQTFYVWIFNVNLLFYSQKYLSGKSA